MLGSVAEVIVAGYDEATGLDPDYRSSLNVNASPGSGRARHIAKGWDR
jgi:hypothetical protein